MRGEIKGILLDTHAWIWWVNGSEELSKEAERVIQICLRKKAIFVSAISTWEAAMLALSGRLQLKAGIEDWLAWNEGLPFLQFIPIDVKTAVKSVNLPGQFHKDPADRIITATGMRMGLPIVTKDEKIRNYEYVDGIW